MRLAACALVCIASLLLTSCGGGGKQGMVEYPGASEQLVTEAEVDRQPSGSPEQTLWAWWRAAQYSDLTEYLDFFQSDVREHLKRTEKGRDDLWFFADAIRTAKPEVLETRVEGDRATVYTTVHYRQPVGLTRYISTTKPQTFTMVREDGWWVFADDFFVDVLAGLARDQRERASGS
jgi:hypothetical protein